MKKGNTILKKPAVLLLTLLMVVCSFPVGAGSGEGAVLLCATAESGAVLDQGEPADEATLQALYDTAQALFDEKDYEAAYEIFEALGTFSNSRARAKDSLRRWNAAMYKKAVSLYDDARLKKEPEKFYEARPIFEALDTYEKSRSYLKKTVWEIQRIEHRAASELFDAGDYEGAKAAFEALGKFRDSAERAQAADDVLKAREKAAEELKTYEKALEFKEQGDLVGAREALIESGDTLDATEQLYVIVDMLTLQGLYQKADKQFAAAEYESSYDGFSLLGDFEDSAERAKLAKDAWQAAVYKDATALQGTDPSRAYILFLFLGDYQDSAALAEGLKAKVELDAVYAAANAFEQEGAYAQAAIGFDAVTPHKDSKKRAASMTESAANLQDFKKASYLKAMREKKQANAIFKSLDKFHNAHLMIEPDFPWFTAKQLRDDRTSEKSEIFTAPDGTKHQYQLFKGVRTWVEAKAFCEVLGGHLATITTEEENTFVHGFMRQNKYTTAYFGLSDEARVGDWIWVTGEPFEYSNWDPGEPSRSGKERYGMYFYKHLKGTWNDSHFYEHTEVDPGCSFFCEWDLTE